MKSLPYLSTIVILIQVYSWISLIDAHLVGHGLSVRFSQLLQTDPKYQTLRRTLTGRNTANLSASCVDDVTVCDDALARLRRKPSKHFFSMAKAIVSYIKSGATAKPSGYVGTAMFCHEQTCIPDMDPPIVFGGCYEYISCSGSRKWRVEPVKDKEQTN